MRAHRRPAVRAMQGADGLGHSRRIRPDIAPPDSLASAVSIQAGARNTRSSGHLAHARDGVSQALEGLVLRFGRLLRQAGRRRGLTDTEAQDLCQEVQIRMWHALASGERIAEAPASYVYRTAMSAAVDMIRRRRARREEPLEIQHDTNERVLPGVVVAAESEHALEHEELAQQVGAVVDGLPEPRNAAVRLYLTGHNHKEIAGLLGWSEAKARNLLYRGLADVRERLTRLGIGPAMAT
jgi:RNA polymerase sigma factor (sigma-70 family)